MIHVLSQTFKSKFIMRYQRVSWALLDQAVISAANFLTVFLLARAMPAAEFGLYMLIFPGLLLLTSVQTALVTEPHNVLAAGLGKEAYRAFTSAAALLQIGVSLGFSLLLLAVGFAVWSLVAEAVGSLLLILAVVLLPWLAQDFVRRVLYTQSDSRNAFINDLVSYGLQLLGVIAITQSQLLQATPNTAFLVLGVSSLVAVFVGLLQLRGHLSPYRQDYRLSRLKRVWTDMWAFGRWRTAENVYQWFGMTGKGWLVAGFLGLELYGGYRAAYHLVHALNPLRQAASAYLPSRGSRIYMSSGFADLNAWAKKIVLLLFAALTPIVIFLVVTAEPLLAIAYEERYSGMGLEWVIIISAVAFAVSFARAPLEIAIMAMKQPRLLFFNSVISFVFLLALSIPLLYLYGVVGYLIANLSTAVMQTLYVLYAYRRLGAKHER